MFNKQKTDHACDTNTHVVAFKLYTMRLQGHVAVMNINTEMLALLGKGGFFGELALLATARRTAQVCDSTQHKYMCQVASVCLSLVLH